MPDSASVTSMRPDPPPLRFGGDDANRRRHDLVHRHRTALGRLLPRHGQEGPHDARAPIGGDADLLPVHAAPRVDLVDVELGGGELLSGGIVKFASDAAAFFILFFFVGYFPTSNVVLTIGSKFVLRWRGKHIFNPTNFGLVVMMLATGRVWVSPGQWGTAAFFAFAVACAGILVVRRAARSDVPLAFLGFYALLLFTRSAALGEPLAIPLHRLQSGALLLFAFFMISDPKTTPDSRPGRILFALLVAGGAAFVQFRLFRTNGLLWSLALFSLLVPLLDRIVPGLRYRWASPPAGVLPFPKGARHETVPASDLARIGPFPPRPSGSSVLRVLRGEGGREAL